MAWRRVLVRGWRLLGTRPSAGIEGDWKVSRDQELWIVTAQPDVVGGINTEAGDVLQKDTLFDSRLAVLVEGLQYFLVLRCNACCAANFKVSDACVKCQ